MSLHVDVLGPVRVRRVPASGPEVDVDLGTPRQRAIVAALALAEGQVVPSWLLVDRVWGDDAPASVAGTLQSYVGQLRRALEPARAPREAARVLVTEHDGYALRVDREARDDVALAEAVSRARGHLAVVADHLRPRADAADGAAIGACHAALEVLTGAGATWRGAPYADLGDHPDAAAARTRLGDLRAVADELRVVARLALGRHAETLGELEAFTRTHPLHERWWVLWSVALARAGRQAEALEALQRLRGVLDDELGVEPSPPVRDLQTAILRQDPSVVWAEPAHGDAATTPRVAAAPPRRAASAPPRLRVSPSLPAWELVGRRAELTTLLDAVERSRRGRAGAVWVTGEAGVGKSRLARELALEAFSRGATVATGECGRRGAPALWPWRQLVGQLETQCDGFAPDLDRRFAPERAEGFESREAVTAALCALAVERQLVLVLEDVHEADAASLALLDHLVATADQHRLLVVATRRSGAGDGEALTEVAAAVARRGGLRLDLAGLPAANGEALVAQVAEAVGTALDRGAAEAIARRAGGNPFYLVELARTAGEVSGALADVVRRRLADLPAETVVAVEAASVAAGGHHRYDDVELLFNDDLVALMCERSRVDVGADLAPAVASGLVEVHDPADAVYRFAHPVVRDLVYDGLADLERGRWHARVAEVLDDYAGLRRPQQRAGLVEHWTRAGYPYVDRAWRSTLRAAEQAGLDADHAEAADLLASALDWQRLDYGSGDRERFDLLVLAADARRWAGDWPGVSDAVDEAVTVAERLGDTGLAARAALSTAEGAIWQVRPYGSVHAPVVAALERAVAALDAEHGATGLRARARVALAVELYYAGDPDRVDALVADGLDLAEQEGDDRLLSLVLPGAFSARWRPDTLTWRRELAARAARVAVRAADPRAHAVALALAACVACEAGDADVVRVVLPQALDLAERQGLATLESVLLVAAVPWRAMAGDDVAAAAGLERLQRLAASSGTPNLAAAGLATATAAALWREDDDELVRLGAVLAQGAGAPGIPMGHLGALVLARRGEVEAARAALTGVEIALGAGLYTDVANAATACELGHALGDADLARRGYRSALPWAGRMASGGSAVLLGPVDGFLALGAAAAGDDDAAAAHLSDAEALASAWRLPRVTERVARLRSRLAG